ncbi:MULTISPECIES: 4-hydroxybenzoate 3-monooxygenase [unclassified Streptomyces]|uniref:4-hydroxybenzoate 3-monooxygenase n=1 Tax=unclassified Streptomyces TaxID=2593676 RepID=UPI000F6F0221|nr:MULTISPECIES: 4-hydroxybenzoate 3-monooxygenase [unclassified Streptomyces]AZM63512.1 4-hydroxybenzoate 3-monooxygenase [Streptomyces sp. WAC 01438]RSM95993.1 4-hydroxybenzoate 3-monooxygenase [Streptomyces sp. WAC 01420]
MTQSSPHPDSLAPQHFPVVVVGAGPAGLTVGNILRAAGVDCLVLETESREFIERRPRAGVIEEWAVRGLQRRGLAGNLLDRAELHTACEFRFDGERYRFSYQELTGHHHWVYPQPLLVTDLVREYADVRGGDIRFGVRDVRLRGLDGDRPSVSYLCPRSGRREVVVCDFVAGCDGARGVSRSSVAPERARVARHDYGIGWLALLAEAPPSADCVLFGCHPDGFAGQMPRSPEVTRYYLQCPPGDDPDSWSHERVWTQLRRRLAAAGAAPPAEGRLIEKRVLDMHDHVTEPMAFGRLFLAGDAAHLVAPIAAKGMNLALHDAFLLGDALVARLTRDDESGLAGYSRECLRRVWDYQEFSQWLSEVYHGAATGDPFRAGTALARLRRLFTSPVAAAAFAEQYLGTAARY